MKRYLSTLAARWIRRRGRVAPEAIRSLANVMPQIVWAVGPDFKTTFINDRWRAYTGFDQANGNNTGADQVVHPEDRGPLLEAWRKASTSGTPFEWEYRLRRFDGVYRWHLGRLAFMRDETGAIVGGYGTATDIEEQRAATEQSRAAENRFRALFHLSPFATVSCRPDGRVNQVNAAYQAMWELTDEFIRDHILHNYTVFEDQLLERLGVMPYARRAFAGETLAAPPVFYDPAQSGLPGRARWLQAHFSSVRNPAGQVEEVILVLNDLTESYQATAELRRKHEELQAILDNSPAIVFIKDLDGRTLLVNREFERVSGLARESVLGKLDEELWPAPLAAHWRESDQAVVRTGQALRAEDEMSLHGETRHFLSIKFPLRHPDGHIRAVCGIVTDVTDQRRADAERTELRVRESLAHESLRLKSEFLANMSHEIRTPINGVIGMTGVLLDSSLTDEQRDYAETIRSSADSLLGIVNDILDFSKIEANKLAFETLDFDLSPLCDETIKGFRVAANNKNLQLHFTQTMTSDESLRGDPGRLRQVLTNLLGNALKFTASGSVSLQVFDEGRGADGRRAIRFEVHDTGIGIPRDALGKMFEPFHQVEASTARRFGGTGLGLSISRRLVEAMGGEIGVESTEGVGSRFWFRLSFERGRATESERHPPLAPMAGGPPRGRILVAEDNVVNQKIAIKQLEKLGFRAEAVANGAEALEALGSLPYDLVLMDVQMPEMDGLEATRCIRESATLGCQGIPIIAMTANAFPEDRERCLAAGMDDYIAKPAKAADLRQIVERWIRGGILQRVA